MLKLASALLIAAVSVAPAYAATSVTLGPAGTLGTAAVIQSFTTPNPGGSPFVPNTTNFSAGSNSPAGFEETEGSPTNITTRNAPRDGMTGAPDSDYLRIVGLGSSYSISFSSTPVALFSFAFHRLGTASNELTLTYSNGMSDVYNLGNNFGASAPLPLFGRLSYDVGFGARIVSAEFTRILPGTTNELHLDDIAVAVPEPAAWMLMILGFGLVGSQLRRRKIKTKVTFATA